MNIIITSLLTISLLVVTPSCKKHTTYSATSAHAVTELPQEELSYDITNDVVTSQNVKC